MTDSTLPVSDPAPTKPGYKTTEFWLKLAAIALTALYASGAVTNNTALAIAGIAATILGALGYTVSRALVKAAGVLLVVGLAASTQISCAAVKHEATLTGNAVVDCTKADKTPIIALLAELGADAITAALGGAVDWAALESKAWAQGKTTGGCAFVALVNGQPKSSARSLLGDPLPTSAELALEELRARWGGVQWLTPGGML